MKSKILWIIFGLCLVVPRVLRVMWPEVQIEDPNYIYGAFLILKGMIPFAEFAQVNPPLLEIFLAGLYKVFGVSHRVPEILSALTYLSSAILIFRIGSRVMNRATGVIASILYSWHFLVFRYHLFERETFATLAILLALEFLTRKEATSRTALVAGLIMGFGFACKQTALIPFATIVAFIALCRQQWRSAIFLCIGFFSFTGFITLGYTAAFGRSYMDQTFWFHWIKGYVAPWYVKTSWTLAGLGFLVPFTLAGLGCLGKIKNDWNWLWLLLIIGDLVFFWFISGAFWPHYLLSTLPFAALLSGLFLSFIGKIAENYIVHAREKCENFRLLAALIIFGTVLAAIQFHSPGAMTGKEAADQFGFSGTPRLEVAQAAKTIRENTSETEMIISDPFIALEAQRIKVVRFKDNWGLILWMNRMIEQGEYREAAKKLSSQRFGDIRRKSQNYWMPLIETAFAKGDVGAVQPNYELQLNDVYLKKLNFKQTYSGSHYTIWTR
ncbi:glycosyltransferase family 39 protein [bacterium]|nr:glycosyltransferase family 39 protein [bacterium]